MKKRVIVLVAMLLCVVMALSACTLSASRVLGDGAYDTDLVPTVASPIEHRGNVLASGDLVVFTDTAVTELDTVVVYNLASGTKLYEGVESVSGENGAVIMTDIKATVGSYGEVSWYCVETTTTTTTDGKVEITKAWSLCDASGAQFATSDNRFAAIETVEDLISFDGKVYRISDEGIAYAFDRRPLAGMPDGIMKIGKYYVAIKRDEYFDPVSVSFYDDELELNGTYFLPQVSGAVAFALNNGNVLIQYRVGEPDTAEEWSYIADGKKYTIVTKLISARNAKEKDVALDCVLIGGYSRAEKAELWKDMGMSEKVANLALAIPVIDGRLGSEGNAALLQLSNRGKVKGEIEVVKGQGVAEILHVARDRWVASTAAEKVYVLDEKGKIVDDISDVTGLMSSSTALGFIYEGRLYDWDLNPGYNLFANEMTVTKVMQNGYVLTKADGALFHLGTDGDAKELIGKDDTGKSYTSISDGLFAVKEVVEGKIKWDVYNSAGAKVLTVDNATEINVRATANEAILLAVSVPAQGTNDAYTAYYRLSA